MSSHAANGAAAAIDAIAAHLASGEIEVAEQLARAALEASPGEPYYWGALGETLVRRGELEKAIECFRRALDLAPGWAEMSNNLAALECRCGKGEAALQVLQGAIRLHPGFAPTQINYARVLVQLGRAEESLAAWDRAIASQPDRADTHYEKGNVLRASLRAREALACFEEAARLQPDWNLPRHNLAEACLRLGDSARAIRNFRRAIALAPGFHPSHGALGVALLQEGQFAEGWREFEWRFGANGATPPRQGTSAPVWDGRLLPEDALVVWMEQGLGDMLQFSRFLPLAARRGARILLQAPPQLAGLLRTIDGVAEVFTGDAPGADYAWQVPLMSLPGKLGVRRDDVPGPIPYLHLPNAAARPRDAFRVGIVWAGSQSNPEFRERDCGFAGMARIATVAGTAVYSFQFGERVRDLDATSSHQVRRLPADLGDFASTALLAMDMDLIVTVDSAMAHLIGALGRPVWTLLPEPADWRWMHGCEDSPWYPTMRLFRQTSPGDWEDVIDRVCAALAVEVRQTTPAP